jgi:hypothetical protein
MSNKHKEVDSPLDALSNESARQRWDLFHRAIFCAKESNNSALVDADLRSEETESSSAPNLTVVR